MDALTNSYIILKTLHLIGIMVWVANLFYLPRILVHQAEAALKGQDTERLIIMARKLFIFGNLLGVPAMILGIWLGIQMNYWTGQGWLHVKTLLVIILFGYNHMTFGMVKKAAKGELNWSSKALRWFNEVPLVIFMLVIFLAVAKSAAF